MIWLTLVLAVLAMGGIAVVAAGGGAPMVDEYDDRPDARVPVGRPLEAADLRTVRFSLAFRGYRMSEVDALLDRMAREVEASRAWQPLDEPARPEPSTGSDVPPTSTWDEPPPPG